MKIHYRRSGGIANIPISLEVDSEQLPQDQSAQLQQLMKAAKIGDEPTRRTSASPIPDDLQHAVEVQDGDKKYALQCNDSGCSPNLLALFDWLHQAALLRLKKKQK